MSSAQRIAVRGRVVTAGPQVIEDGVVVLDGGTITAVAPARDVDLVGMDVLQVDGGYVLPGLVDVHNHGGGGAGFPDAADADTALRAVRQHRSHGTTTLVASLVTAPPHVLHARTRTLAALAEAGEIAGIHLEGPFISAARCGAQNPHAIQAPDTALTAQLLEVGGGHVVTMTLAPECDGVTEVVATLVSGGALPSFGHTDAEPAATRAALDAAAESIAATPAARSGKPTVTHLFNAMRPLAHRDPGPIPAFLSAAARGRAVVELIADGVHLAPSLVRDVYEIVGRDGAVLVTDAMAAAGMADGDYEFGGLPVTVTGGAARLREGGAIAGGTAHLIDVVRATWRAGVPLPDAVYMATAGPARILGRTDVGALAIGMRADVVLTDADLQPLTVLRGGERSGTRST